MIVTETKKTTREIYVAPCVKCGGSDIHLSHNNDSSFNMGGGKCVKCGHEVVVDLSINPVVGQMAAAWNAKNDIATLIRAEKGVIALAQSNILELESKHWYKAHQA
jgi:hypothetical protein